MNLLNLEIDNNQMILTSHPFCYFNSPMVKTAQSSAKLLLSVSTLPQSVAACMRR